MQPGFSREHRHATWKDREAETLTARHWTVLLAALSAVFVCFAAFERHSLETVWGDESTYLAMAESLARDGDLSFTEADAGRLAAVEASSRDHVILQRTAAGVAYSKPLLYALLAAPGVVIAGELGLLLVNCCCLLVACGFGWLFLCRLGGGERAALTVVTFVGASALLANIGWRMSDLLQATLALAGLVLAVAALRRPPGAAAGFLDRPAAAWSGGFLLGLLVTCRQPNLVILVAAVLALVVVGRHRRALYTAGGAVAAILLIAALSHQLLGSVNPYRAVRATFDAETGYPLAPGDDAFDRFTEFRSTQRMTVRPNWRADVSGYAALYFWVGRHTGLLWYFPALLALLTTALYRPDRVTAILLSGAAAVAAFYLIWWPENYFGGASFIGNRYFLPAYPLLLVALPRLPGNRALALSWLVALVVAGSAVVSLVAAEPASRSSQSHARAGLLRLLPFESTARAIDGRRDRYWERDFVRFLDSQPRVGKDRFTLLPGAPAAELMIVNRAAESPTLLRYSTRGKELSLVVDGEQRLPLAGTGGGAVRRGTLLIEPRPAWRRHRFWWDDEQRYAARTVRLAVAGESEERVTLWYGGDPAMLEQVFETTGPGLVLPRRAVAGTTTELAARVRNMSPVPWSHAGGFPVVLSYRFEGPLGGEARMSEGRRAQLPADLPSGDPVDLVLPVLWPEVPGRYRLTVDLLIEDFAWFESRVGKPLASAEVTVVPASLEEG